MRGEVSSGVVAPGEFKDSEKLGDWRFNAVPPNGSGRDPVFPISHSERGAVGVTDPSSLWRTKHLDLRRLQEKKIVRAKLRV